MNLAKNLMVVDFPFKDFNVFDYLSPLEKHYNKSTVYELSAVSNHFGSMGHGHYTAFCKNAHEQQ